MKAKVADVHDSHGLIFTLGLEKSAGGKDNDVIDFLRERLNHMISGELRNTSTLYIHRIKVTREGVTLQFVEAGKRSALVNDVLNSRRPHRNHTVLLIEGEEDIVPSGS